MMGTHFSYDISREERKEYYKEFPLLKIGDDGMLMRRTHLYVLRKRKEVDGELQHDGNACEAGYINVAGELLGYTWLGMIAYTIYKYIKKNR